MPHRDIHLDFNESILESRNNGISEQDLAQLTENFLQIHRGLRAMQEMGQVQFMNLPFLGDSLGKVKSAAAELQEEFDTMVVLGIGGSGLGAKAIGEATQPPRPPGAPAAGKKSLLVLDSLHPESIAALLDSLPLERTVFDVVSKSGNTVETMAQFLIFFEHLRQRLGEEKFRRHLVMTTDARKGTLRELCEAEQFRSFEILPGVGGRFSVLSPVGLLPAAFLGVSIEEMAEGAVHMDRRCKIEDLWTNPAAMMAAVTFGLSQRGKRQLVVFNYDDPLRGCVEWFAQLWAESLGKLKNLKGEEVRAGITPVAASGPRDQHSQVQLYAEGPADKMVMFWSQEKYAQDPVVPEGFPARESLSYLGGKKLSEILSAELQATEQALADAGVPSFKMMLYGRDAYTLGQLFYLLEIVTVYVGGFFNVNPFEQPGVELGKKYLYGKLGRQGYEEFGAKLTRKIKDKRYIV